MSLFDDDNIKPKTDHIVGRDLSQLSVDDLAERIVALEAEIERLKQEKDKKASGIKAAEALFKI